MQLISKFFLFLFLCLLLSKATKAQNSVEYYRSLFLVKFIKYANWEKLPNHYTIGVIGNSPIVPFLKTMTKDKMINGKTVLFSKISSYANLERYSLLYIPKSQNSKFNYIVTLTKNSSILIVSEDAKFIRKGASISFYEENNALKFKINNTTIDRQKIQISNRLLSVGLIVK